MNQILFIVASVLFAHSVHAKNIDQLLDMSLQELMQVNIDTASVFETSWHKQPATVSLLTASELRSLGARNLMEALEFVPGVSFAVDVYGVIGIAFRGQWAHEGKVLLLLDDMPLNDLAYGNLNFARHYPIEQIEKIEVLRGAGSAKYGGNAQLAVIRVTTRLHHLNQAEMHVSYSHQQGAGNGKKITLQGGKKFSDGHFGISVHAAQEPWSGRTWQDTAGSLTDLSDTTEFKASNILARMQWKGLRLEAFIDNHKSKTPQDYGYSTLGESVYFDSRNFLLEYAWKIDPSLTIKPQFRHTYQEDWSIEYDRAVNPSLPATDAIFPTQRDSVNLDLLKRYTNVNVLAGINYWSEKGWCESIADFGSCTNALDGVNDVVRNHAKGVYVQADWQGNPWVVSTGLRYSDHSYVGSSTVPRLSLVYPRDDWQLKFLFSEAFREPNLFVITDSDPNVDMKPEVTIQKEIELSWSLSRFWNASASIYSTRTRDPIIYIEQATPFYANYDHVATQGFETEWRWRQGNHSANLAYSFYEVQGSPNQLYADNIHTDQHVGIPNQKLSADYAFKLPRSRWNLQGALVWYNRLDAYVYTPGADIDGNGTQLALTGLDSKTYVNVSASYRTKAWNLHLGVRDLADEGRIYPQPYLNTNPPSTSISYASTPYNGPGREFWARLTLKF